MTKDPSKSSKDDISKMSSLLLSGATMLADSCPDCNVPLFKRGDNIFCPKCGRKAIYADSDEEVKQIHHIESVKETKELLQDILVGKINFLAKKLAEMENLDEIKSLNQLLFEILETFDHVKKI
ncbi:MAG: Sjogren's syndrome/scleroderma autoantigen 1 family protein [Candidatus Hodarchaeales archaeon]